jgi:hypothetical protein
MPRSGQCLMLDSLPPGLGIRGHDPPGLRYQYPQAETLLFIGESLVGHGHPTGLGRLGAFKGPTGGGGSW